MWKSSFKLLSSLCLRRYGQLIIFRKGLLNPISAGCEIKAFSQCTRNRSCHSSIVIFSSIATRRRHQKYLSPLLCLQGVQLPVNIKRSCLCLEPSKEIRLIDEQGKNLGLVPYSEAKRQAEDRGLMLKLVGKRKEPDAPLTYRLTAPGDNDTQTLSQDPIPSKPTKTKLKELGFNSGIGDQDFEHKSRQITKFLEENFPVRIIVKRRSRSKIPVEGIVNKLLSRFNEIAKLDGSIKELPNGVQFNLKPLKK